MDPNQIVGTPKERWVWLAPDWSASKPVTAQQPSGYTRVRVRDIMFADGRIVTVVLNEDGEPVGADGQATTPDKARVLDQQTDEEQAKRYKDQQAQANKPPEERNNNGRRERWNPNKNGTGQGGWEDVGTAIDTSAGGNSTTTSTGTPRVPAGSIPRTEGTPIKDANGNITGYDNSQPIRVWHAPDGKLIYEALTPQERLDWEKQKNGGKTDAEVAAASQPQSAEDQQAVPNRPGWVAITRKTVQNGNATTKTVYRGPDGKEVDSLPEQPKSDRKPVEGQPGVYLVSTTTGGATETHFENEAGQRIQAPPNIPWTITSGGVTYIRGQDGSYAPAKGIPTGAEPAGAPQPSGRLGEAAADLQSYQQWLNAQVDAGKLTTDQADKRLEARLKFWQTALSEQNGVVNAQRGLYQDQLTQRSQTLTDLANRRSNTTQIALSDPNGLTGLADKLGAAPGGGADLMAALRQSRINAADMVTLSGANRQVPEIAMGPAAQTVNGLPLPGGVAPQMAPGFTPRPNAIGVGSIGSVGAPGAAPAPAGARPTPVFTPQPVAPFPGAPAPTYPGARDNNSPQAAIQPSPYFLAGDSRGNAYDPTPSIQAMIADPTVDNATLRQVVSEEYPGYPIDQVLRAA